MSLKDFKSLQDVNKLLGFNDEIGGNKTSQWLINNGYGSNVIVYSIINKIVSTSLDVPLIVVDRDGELVEEGELVDKLKQPAIYQGEFLDTKAWVEYAMTYLLTSGNLYQRLVELDGIKGLPELEIIPSGIILPIPSSSYLKPNNGFKVSDKNNQAFTIESDEVKHTKYINPTTFGLDNMVGLSPLQAGIFSLEGSTDIQKALAVIVKNQGVRGILSNDSDRSMDVGMAKVLKAALTGLIRGVDKINSVLVSNTKVSFVPMGMSVADLKLIESGVLTDRQICNLYSVDSKLFNDPQASTFNNINEATKGLYNDAIIPNLNKVVGSFNETVTKQFNSTGTDKQKVVVDTKNIEALQSDQSTEATKDKILTEGITNILTMPISTDSKVSTLEHVYGMSEELARNIVGNGQITED